MSVNQKRDKENMPEKSRPQMPFRKHDTSLHDFTFSCARTKGSHVAGMISMRFPGRRGEEKHHSRAVSVI